MRQGSGFFETGHSARETRANRTLATGLILVVVSIAFGIAAVWQGTGETQNRLAGTAGLIAVGGVPATIVGGTLRADVR